MTGTKSTVAIAMLLMAGAAQAGQAPGAESGPDIGISHRDRVYTADQFSNTISVTDPLTNRMLGVIRLGDPQPGNLSPLYRGQLLVHGLGFSPDRRSIAAVSIGSNSVTLIDTATNAVRRTAYLGRSPHEAFFTPDGREIWVTVRGEDYVAVLDASSLEEKTRITVLGGPGMQIFSPDGKYGYVCSSFNPETVIITVSDRRIVGRVKQDSPFCPNIAATPDGKQVWMTLKDTGRVMVFDAHPPFGILRSIETGPITNHVNFVSNSQGKFAYVTVGGENKVKVFRLDDFVNTATIDVGRLPHGVWPSGDGTRVYVGLENDDALVAIDTLTNKIIATSPVGQAPQALLYVPNAVPDGSGLSNLEPLGVAGHTFGLQLVDATRRDVDIRSAPTSVSLFDQGLTQVLEASVSGLQPSGAYVLALASTPDGSGPLQPLSAFKTSASGSAVVNAVGPIRQIVNGENGVERSYLIIAAGTPERLGQVIQVQAER